MTTVALIRSTYLDIYLHRAAASVKPWSDAELQQYITDTLNKLWPRNGNFVFGDVATSSTTMLYTVPAAFGSKFRISRIEVVDASGLYVDRITSWRIHSPTQIVVKPLMASGLTLRLYGWTPFLVAATDLPTDLESTVAQRAAARAYAGLAAELVNSERQQNLDSGRVVSYQDAIALSAYYERLFQDGIKEHPSELSYGPRAAHRG